MSDLIRREDAINAVAVAVLDDKDELEAIKAIPSAKGGDADMTVIPEGTGLMTPCPDNGADLISRQDAIEAVGKLLVDKQTARVDGKFVPLHFALMNTLSTLPSADAVSMEEHIKELNDLAVSWKKRIDELEHLSIEDRIRIMYDAKEDVHNVRIIDGTTSAEAVQGAWIPVSERLPEDIKPVIITWKNTDPASYYQYIVGKHFIGTGHYCNGKWYWYSSVCEDLLAEYGKSDADEVDEAIEVVAWIPLPTPYKGGDTE